MIPVQAHTGQLLSGGFDFCEFDPGNLDHRPGCEPDLTTATDPRLALANIWVVLEALFGKRDDRHTTEALARRISEWLPSRTDIDVSEVYDQRCDAVHGRSLNEEEIWHAIKRSERLLKLAIIRCIETDTKTLLDWK